MITQQLLHELFKYKDGNLYWKVKPCKNISIGAKAGSKAHNGYLVVGIKNKVYLIHRIVFMLHHGYLPKFIDHIDEDKTNNKIENLREATSSENKCNISLKKNNTSGIKGVFWEKSRKKWRASCIKNGKRYDAGFYADIEDAKKAVEILRNSIHGSFAKN